MIIGIQFIIGSVDEKAKIKETLVPYVIGVFIIFSAFGIWKIVMSIGNITKNFVVFFISSPHILFISSHFFSFQAVLFFDPPH